MSIKELLKMISSVLLLPFIAVAEPVKVDKPIECYKLENALKQIMSEFGEQPIWLGGTAQGYQSGLFLNPKTSTWTFVTAPNSDTLCIIEHGTGFQLRATNSKLGKDI